MAALLAVLFFLSCIGAGLSLALLVHALRQYLVDARDALYISRMDKEIKHLDDAGVVLRAEWIAHNAFNELGDEIWE